MPREIEGSLSAKGLRVGIIVSRFNSFITQRLLDGALDALARSGADDGDLVVARVPGAREIPLVAKAMAESGQYDAVICHGAVIRGATPHFVYGVLTTDTIEQAVERAGTKAGNRGHDAAVTAIEMAGLLKQMAAG